MIVSRNLFPEMLEFLKGFKRINLDSETTGLRPYHGDRLFSLILTVITPEKRVKANYLNFQPYEGLDPGLILLPSHLAQLKVLFDDPTITWEMHNAKYDMAILANEGIALAGTIWCTKAMARIENNEQTDYSLAACGERIGAKKDETVEQYIETHKLWDWENIPGKKTRNKNKHYDRVPFPIISEYGLTDGKVGARVGHRQAQAFEYLENKQAVKEKRPPGQRVSNIIQNEQALTKVVFAMEKRGILIDLKYTQRAAAFEQDRLQKALLAFKQETGRELSQSGKLFSEVFAVEKARWVYGEPTKTGQVNPSFESDILKTFIHPAAKIVLDARNAKSKADFYLGFLYHADSNGVVHPNFNPDGTRTGRFSSSNPNLQNLTDEEGDEAQEFIVRRAIIPRPGHCFLLPDYDQMEYRMMLDYAGEMELIQKVLGGLDVHLATAQMMGVTRKEAKTLNFMLLYGGGVAKLCMALFSPTVGEATLRDLAWMHLYNKHVKNPPELPQDVVDHNVAELRKALVLRDKYFQALPGVQKFITETINSVHTNYAIYNWAGRLCRYDNLAYDYTAPNTLIQGGTADVNKFGLVAIDKYLACKKSKLVLTIHDENPIECHEDEVDEVPRMVKQIMESIYPARHLPLTVGVEHSWESLGDKVKGYPGSPRAVGSAGNPHAACAREAVATPC